MADSFLGIFDGIGDTIDGLFNTVKDAVGLDTTSGSSDFFGNKVAGALFNGAASSLGKDSNPSVPSWGMVGVGRQSGRATKTGPAPFTDPRQLEKEWTERLWRFSNMDKMISNTAGKLPNG